MKGAGIPKAFTQLFEIRAGWPGTFPRLLMLQKKMLSAGFQKKQVEAFGKLDLQRGIVGKFLIVSKCYYFDSKSDVSQGPEKQEKKKIK